ncbi:hypothetical protein LPJ64_006450, partial [Coemansia asiatica]
TMSSAKMSQMCTGSCTTEIWLLFSISSILWMVCTLMARFLNSSDAQKSQLLLLLMLHLLLQLQFLLVQMSMLL